jgi:hypothetical protein
MNCSTVRKTEGMDVYQPVGEPMSFGDSDVSTPASLPGPLQAHSTACLESPPR